MKCSDVYNLFFKPGEVTEIRAYGLSRSNPAWEGWAGGGGVVFGYFDNPTAFGQCAEALDKAKAPGIYFTLNPCIPDLLARAANRLKAADAKSSSTSDHDILALRWLPIDLDPIRPAGISSTDDELKAALALRNKILKFFKAKRSDMYIVPACSGNGAHLSIRYTTDIPLQPWDADKNREKIESVKRALGAISNKFKDPKVDVDLSVHNPSRIWKLYGTTTRKGDSIPTRPHRRSYVEPKFLDKQNNPET